MFKRILVAVDGSPTSNHGLNVAAGLAKEQAAELIALHVVELTSVGRGFSGAEFAPPAYFETMLADLREAGRKTLVKSEAVASKAGQTVKTVLTETIGESVAHAILVQARKLRADLIVMGTHGRRGLSRIVMGSDAEGVLREARVPVLLVRGPAPRHVSRGVTKASATRRADESALPSAAVAPV